jgi:hypothetical protein
VRLLARNEPLKSEPWTWLRGETNPQRWVEEETVEGVRNAAAIRTGLKTRKGSESARRDRDSWIRGGQRAEDTDLHHYRQQTVAGEGVQRPNGFIEDTVGR